MLFADVAAPKLVGIARLAAQGDSLEAKRRVQYFDLPVRSYFARCPSGRVPFDWSLNPYRGCEFGCRYCYARYTHEFMELRGPLQFERQIYAKQWSEVDFRRQLRRIPSSQAIGIGTATDPYQPAERRFGITRKMLGVLAGERGRTLSLVTKSDLVARDADLLREISRGNILHVGITITTVDARLARLLESYAPAPELRLGALARLREAGVMAGVLANPVMPCLTDSRASLGALAAAARRAGAVSLHGGLLFLKPCAWKVFLPFLELHFPDLAPRYRALFGSGAFLRGEYEAEIREMVRDIRKEHGLTAEAPDYTPEAWPPEPQMTLAFES